MWRNYPKVLSKVYPEVTAKAVNIILHFYVTNIIKILSF